MSNFNPQNWSSLSIPAQLGNIGSEYDRILNWKEKNQPEYSRKAFIRTLGLIDLTSSDLRWKGSKLKELLRVREWICQEFFLEDGKPTGSNLKKYFLQYAILAQANKKHQ